MIIYFSSPVPLLTHFARSVLESSRTFSCKVPRPLRNQQHRSFAFTLVLPQITRLLLVVTIQRLDTKTGMVDSEAKGHALMAEAKAKLQKSTGFMAFIFGCGLPYLFVWRQITFPYDSCSRSQCALEAHLNLQSLVHPLICHKILREFRSHLGVPLIIFATLEHSGNKIKITVFIGAFNIFALLMSSNC